MKKWFGIIGVVVFLFFFWTFIHDIEKNEIKPVSEIREPSTITSVNPKSSEPITVTVTIKKSSAEKSDVDLSKFEKVTVKKVVDGDTFWAIFSDTTEQKIRLIGIDTPESVSSDESKNCEEGREASDYTKGLIKKNDYVYLEYDAGKEDKYGRTLAYVYLADGRMLQDILLSEGYARVMTVQPNIKYQEHFIEVEREAQENGMGFWNNFFK